jgi:hypothetical protein
MKRSVVTTLSIVTLMLSPACGVDASKPDQPAATVTQRLVDANPVSVARAYLPLDLAFPAGVAAGRDVVFVGSPFEGRVAAYSRLRKTYIGGLPPPPSGFALPFIMKSVGDDRVAVLDAGGFPSPKPFVPSTPTIYEYSYKYRPASGFTAELVRTLSATGATIGFSENAIKLDDGRYLINDAVLGSIWIVETDGTVKPGLVPKTFEPQDAIPQTYFCDTMPLIQVGGIPFLFTDSTVPGITGMAAREGILYFSASCAGAVYSIPLASLSDDREPWERAADIRLVSPKPEGVAVEELLDITFNPFAPHDPYVYAADALQLRVIRINVETGERQVVSDDPHLLNFPSSLSFAPPLGPSGPTPLFAVSNQQHRTPLLNDAITEDMLQPPFLLTEITVRH